MKLSATAPTGGTQKVSRKKQENTSPDGKWRSFPKVPNLLQYINTGTFFARTKVNGKLIRQSLDTDVFTTAKLRLPDFIKKQQAKRRVEGTPETFADAQKLYEQDLENDGSVSENSKRYRRYCIQKLNQTWPTLAGVRVDRRLSATDFEAWAGRVCKLVDAGEVDEQYFNNMLGTVRAILKRAGVTGEDDPTRNIKRRSVIVPQVKLPTLEQFQKILREMETSGAGQQQNCADFARLLAYSGARLSEARRITWADVDMDAARITIHNAKTRRTGGEVHATRTFKMIPPLRDLLAQLASRPHNQTDRVLAVGECEKSLRRACKIVGVQPLTHHKLRDLFATICIESGIDIPTVARWLGHSERDKGALLLRRYHKHRDEHADQAADRVTFTPPTNVVSMPVSGVISAPDTKAASI